MRELPQAKPDGFASSLWEGASGAPANFALQPETVPLCQRPHLRGRLPPLRGKMSPQVTKRGICRRRRLGEFRQEPLQSLLRKASSPKGAPLGYAGNFAATAEAVPLRADFPRPGEDVAQRQKGECGLTRSGKTEGVFPHSGAHLKSFCRQVCLDFPLKLC